jgi:hypothetical protein
LDTGVSSVDAGCSKRRTNPYFCAVPPIVLRSTWICEPGVSSSDASQRSQLPPNKFRSCHSAFRKARHSKGCYRPGRHHCNTVSPVEHVPNKPTWFHWFARRPHPNSKHNGWLDPLSSGCRFRFFLLHKGVQLIQFSVLRLFRHRSRRQLVHISADTIRHALLADFQYPADGSLAIAFHV